MPNSGKAIRDRSSGHSDRLTSNGRIHLTDVFVYNDVVVPPKIVFAYKERIRKLGATFWLDFYDV